MNILLIEDERELRESGVAQLELHQYTVYPVSNLAEAHAVMENPTMPVHLVLADHSLPDGQGIHFVIEMKAQFADCQYAIVSGCLTDGDVSLLEEREIPFFRKPQLYGKVVEGFRRAHLMKTSCRESAPEVLSDEVVVPSEVEAAPCSEPEAPKPKKWFGLFDK